MTNKLAGVLLLMLSFVGGWAWMDYRSALSTPVFKRGSVVIEVERGDSLSRIVTKLRRQNLKINPIWFKAIALSKNAANKLKTGEYEFKAGMTIPQIIDMMVKGKIRHHSITFPEGMRFSEMLASINNLSEINHEIRQSNPDSLRRLLGLTESNAEGLLFPDTYFYEKNMSDLTLLKRAYAKMQAVLQEEWRSRTSGLPFKTPYEALIMASIVEKESAADHERPQIAGVLIRRLQSGMPLQTDPTVIYGMGDAYNGNITEKDLKNLTPYNTYLQKGLPPTPISMPGRAAIHAALHPDSSDSLYFVSRGDGTHVFSSTLRDHNQAVALFQKQKK